MSNERTHLTLDEVAAELGISKSGALLLVTGDQGHAPELSAYVAGGQIVVPVVALHAYRARKGAL